MNEILKAKIDLLKDVPGSYQMKDKCGKIIYVGKAKSLLKRVKQYFYRPQVGKVFLMVQEIEDFDIIETTSEKEALLLEINLIRKYYPKYNILLKDGKSYPYIALRKKGDPQLKIAYKNNDKNFVYFGPFPSSKSCYSIIDLLNKIYPLRKCKVIPKSPCLYYHLNQCMGPCINKIEQKVYDDAILDIERFLNGDALNITSKIKTKMKEASNNLEFEKAQEYKNILESINHVQEKQATSNVDKVSKDVIAISKRDFYLSLAILTYRNGNLLGKNIFVVDEEEDEEEQLISLLYQYYQNHELPKEMIIANPNIKESLKEIFSCKVIVPSRGIKKEFLLLALENAKNGIDEHFMTARLEDNMLSLLDDFASILNIKTPLRIELFDNSHLQGEEAIGAMVVFINGQKAPSMYRKFNINDSDGKDDLASMKEVLTRRYKRLKEENQSFPDLIILDGGETQLGIGQEVLKELELDIPLCALKKDDHHHTAFLLTQYGEVITLKEHQKLFFFLVRMQDEVHRFAISTHRKKREKKVTKSIFDDIKGIGIKKKEYLLKAYPSLEDLKNASKNELLAIVSEDIATEIINKLKNI